MATEKDGRVTAGHDATYRELFERSPDAILIIEGDRFIDCNDATVRMLRYQSREELLQTHPSELSPELQPDGRPSYEKVNEMMRLAFEQGSHRFEWEHKRADGDVLPVEVLLTAVPRGDRTLLHVVWRDISDRKRLETELRQAQKMEAVGRLAGGVAHDFNNLLVAILGHADLLALKMGGDAEVKKHVDQIRHASKRAADLVAQLLAFSRKQVLQPKVVDLNEVIDDLGEMLERLLGEDIRIEHRRDPAPLPVLIDPGKLEQVVVNLATNARDAMPEGGSLGFTTSRRSVDRRAVAGRQKVEAGRYAVLEVADSGTGIDPEALGRIFEPFFTTKEQGRGTGLGLSTVYGIVKQSGGETLVESQKGRGTTFRVFLPLSEVQTAQPRSGLREVTTGAGGREHILLVEDEPSVLELVEQVLASEGYTVYSATTGDEAVAMVEARELRVDLLMTDVVMPGMGGPELASRLKASHPRLKVLFSSGYTDDALSQRGALRDEVELIEKPFTPEALLLRLRKLLDS